MSPADLVLTFMGYDLSVSASEREGHGVPVACTELTFTYTTVVSPRQVARLTASPHCSPSHLACRSFHEPTRPFYSVLLSDFFTLVKRLVTEIFTLSPSVMEKFNKIGLFFTLESGMEFAYC
jgi:hypothetical protein